MATVDYFLKIDGIEGESQDAKHKAEIEIDSFGWGQTQGGNADTHGGRAVPSERRSGRASSADTRTAIAR